jgi:hypothetical protein
MATDINVDAGTQDIDLASGVTGTANAKQQIATIVASAVDEVGPIKGRGSKRDLLTSRIRDRLLSHPYVEDVVSLSSTQSERTTVQVTVNLVSNDAITVTQ